MNSEKPHSNHEQLEARLTALLLGELPADEAERLSRAIEHDPALAKLHERLKQTVRLVKAASTSPQDPAINGAEPLKLEEKRRQELLARFKTITPRDFTPKPKARFRLLELAALVAIIGMLAAMLVPALSKAKYKHTRIGGDLAYSPADRPARNTQNTKSIEAGRPALPNGTPPSQPGAVVNFTKSPSASVALPTFETASTETLSSPTYSVNSGYALSAVQGPNSSYSTLPADRNSTLGSSPNGADASISLSASYERRAPMQVVSSSVAAADGDNFRFYLDLNRNQKSNPSEWEKVTSEAAPLPNSGPKPAAVESRAGGIVLPRSGEAATANKLAGATSAASDNLGNYAILADSFTPTTISGRVSGFGGGGGGGGGGAGSTTADTIALNWDDAAHKNANKDGLGDIGGERALRGMDGELLRRNGFGPQPEQSAANPAASLPPLATRPLAETTPAMDPATGLPVGAGPTIEPTTGLPSVETPAPSAAGNEKLVAQTMKLEPNQTQPEVQVKAKFVEVGQSDSNAVGFNYYLGNALADSGRTGKQEIANLDTGTTRQDLFESKSIPGEANGKGQRDPMHQKQGNLGLADGSVSQFSRAKLAESLKNSGDVVQAAQPNIALPSVASTDSDTFSLGDAAVLDRKSSERLVAAGSNSESYSRDRFYKLTSRLEGEQESASEAADNKAKTPEPGLLGAIVTNGTFLAGKDWNFPASSVTNAGSLARVERGAAWQTVLLPSQDEAKKGRMAEDSSRTRAESRLALNDRERTLRDRTAESVDTSLPKTTPVEILDLAQAAQPEKPTLGTKIRGFFSGETERKARIKIERDQSDISGTDQTVSQGYDPYFIQTEFETIQSDKVLGKVVKDLNLGQEWAKKSDGKPLDDSQAIALLKKKLDLRPVRNTSFIEIGAKGQNAEEAAKLANAVANAYKDHRAEQRKEMAMAGISALEQGLARNQQKIAEAQKEVERLGRGLQSTNPTVAAKEIDQPLARKPAADAPVPQPEIATAENAFSTFSLNVSDVSFKLAAASLEQGAMPEANSVRTEEFINAFDYRDPEPSAGIPVAFAWERARYPFSQNRDLVRLSLKTAAAGRQPGKPMNVVLLMDNSGSMERADRVTIIREALKVLAAQLRPEDKFSVVTFSRTARLAVDGVAGNEAAQAAETVSGLTPEGGTNLEEAMKLAYDTALRHYLTNGINRVVLLTDGAANLGDVEPESLKQKVEANRKQGIAFDCFGIGWEGYNDDLLEVLSRNGDGRYGFINTPEEAATEFVGQLAGALHVAASDVKVQVEFNPKRVTVYRQLGYAKHQLTKEQFRDNTVDAAELGAAEAGNALYVIEVNAAGTGALGTVRVRYKVPGTSDYREQEWALPYNGTAVALDQSSTTMKLAASASAFSEWLVASPYAGEVTPDALLGYLRGVPEVYGADGRPKKLEWMLRQAKSISGH